VAQRVEAFVGEYAAGKSEVAVNRALAYLAQGEQVTLVDLDLVEPTYTLRPLKAQLTEMGLRVIAWSTKETTGLGEAGMILHPDAKSALHHAGTVVLDVGYGPYGSSVLNLVEGALEHPRLELLLVVNTARPLTSTVDGIEDEARRFTRITGLVNNTHLGEETEMQLVQRGAELVSLAARRLDLPVVATCALQSLAAEMGPEDIMGNPVWPLKRYLHTAFW
jgi:hypothetical protein